MDYEKKYKEALERASKLRVQNPFDTVSQMMEHVFPELKESKDEKIRKWLIGYFHQYKEDGMEKYANGLEVESIIAWLEKQSDKCLVNFDEAEQEKYDFVSEQYIECRASFNEFKEDNSYWLEYIGNDTYIGRSDNILNQKFHITPRQLFTLFTQQHCPKENNVNEETNAPTGYGKYVDECLNEAAKHFFSEGEDKYSVADLFYAGVRCGKFWLEKQGEPAKLSEEEQNRFAKGVLSSCALSFINYLDAHKYEGKMCVSNGECEDIENAFHNAMWDRLHRYYCKYIEKQTSTKVKDFSENREDLSVFYKQVCHMAASLLNKEYDYTMETIEWYAYTLLEYAKKELEKQDEKPQGKSAVEADKEEKIDNANKVEPKFKVGNWYQCTKDFFGKGVTFDKNTAYYCAKEGCLQNEYGCHIAIVKDLYDNFKLWTIEDAKDGDVLYSLDSNQSFIYKERNRYAQATAYCGLNIFGRFFVWDTKDCVITLSNYVPATKEQRDLLFAKMTESGYKWDAEKKELKKIEDEPENYKQHLMNEMAELVKDYIRKKSAWSEEDEKNLNSILSCIKHCQFEDTEALYNGNLFVDPKRYDSMSDWLKSLKERLL